MQPQPPFIREIGRNMSGDGWTIDHEEGRSIWQQLRDGRCPVDFLWSAVEGERREITSDPSVERESIIDQETVEQRLKALSYN
jgi:hypothetical protein